MMRELTFFTTNQFKLAHARYLAEGRNVRIKGFRQRTYHAGYVEPRLSSRNEILRASYISAKLQLRKAGISENSHPFILEDTSVRINALSTDRKEVPGVDIKYWMDEQTFSNLDAKLRLNGNDRSATVRSDVLLHIPASFRSSWGVEEDFIVFTGEQHGSIVETERPFSPNLVYPWLDDRSFNKWFVPKSTDRPLGALPISIADTVDFRRASFGQLFDFLEARNFFTNPESQMQLHLDHKPNLLLCGYTCSGKTTASQHLARRYGYLHIEASDFMHLAYYYRHGSRGHTGIGDFAEHALDQQPTIAAEKVVEYMDDYLAEPVVISGFRAPQEVEFLQRAMTARGKPFSQYFITAGETVRFERLSTRERPGDDLTIDEFRSRDLQQQRMGLDAISQALETVEIINETDLNSYILQIDELVDKNDKNEIDVEVGLAALSDIKDVGLQDAIVVALLKVWRNDEARQFYSTTEVSTLITTTFPSIRPKHKDNVSRYFNQDFYAYFEISSGPASATRKYRLSNTGYGMAIRTLRSLLKR